MRLGKVKWLPEGLDAGRVEALDGGLPADFDFLSLDCALQDAALHDSLAAGETGQRVLFDATGQTVFLMVSAPDQTMRGAVAKRPGAGGWGHVILDGGKMVTFRRGQVKGAVVLQRLASGEEDFEVRVRLERGRVAEVLDP